MNPNSAMSVEHRMDTRNIGEQASALVKSVLLPFVSRKRGTVPYPNYDGSQVCAQIDPEIFFPEKNNGPLPPAKVKQFCAGCPFQVDCLAYALSNNVVGIWGGTTGLDRRHIRRRYAIPLDGLND